MIDELYHSKQLEVLNFALNNDYFMLINYGAKRTGKTIIDNDLFLLELRRVRKIANELGIKLPQYILAGADLGALQRNVLSELTNKYDIEFKFDKHNRFVLFGVQVCCFGHSKTNDLGRIRGMTSFGAYINEGTVANEEVFNEIKSRCSGEGARILVDTNPDQPEHWLKTNFVDKTDGKVIQSFHYKLDDNIFLSERYRANIKKSTPSGVFYDRDINGLWVSADGLVYQDFNKDIHYISKDKLNDINFVRYFAGVDWGYEHFGAIVVIGEDDKGNLYLLEEHSAQHKEIDYWIDKAKSIKEKYGNIKFYCDSARPEHLAAFKRNGIKAFNANKAVLSGVEAVAKRIKTNTLFVVHENVNLFRKEIFMYAWNKNTGEPIKKWDDALDALRYAIYTDSLGTGIKVLTPNGRR
ncbi:PBSX family phage terminase large subunit [Clostridioides difficile]|jgi:PBSX family phage terminase large subunit|uniref:PBSX family phage terminase large subunit n=2 Tax=Clostridioides difficile TaxID=1496 RepID=UPI00038C9268|nr:PBSX family phage terminase large subunit [Clostridioides difficile]EQF82757.1 phage terminase, large subunit, PBSX family [Clostridioides difficile CD196]DAI87141.1 MAG TPA: large terminase [Caudoviricetes sp.]AXB65825.1 terminase large subunit [Clostridioides difficile]EGT3705301.1 PBSX family phage terminase large subunit [Clostridioides difficile]EGT3862057.1 PBSX family phage terminase large subunit [Clostridioides difficile]